MTWFRRRPAAPSLRRSSEYERVCERVRQLREREDLSTAVTDVDTASPAVRSSSSSGAGTPSPAGSFPSAVPAAAPVEPAPGSPVSSRPDLSGRGGTPSCWCCVDGEAVGPDQIVTCRCGRVAPCRHHP